MVLQPRRRQQQRPLNRQQRRRLHRHQVRRILTLLSHHKQRSGLLPTSFSLRPKPTSQAPEKFLLCPAVVFSAGQAVGSNGALLEAETCRLTSTETLNIFSV